MKILQDNPEAGTPVENLVGYRDLIQTFGASEYIIRDWEKSHRIVIVRVRHSKEENC